MLWVALHCPTLPLDRILRRLPEALAPMLAFAVTESSGSRRNIALASTAASAAGVQPGQAVASALALLPELMLIERDADDEAAALREAALAALRFTPAVTLTDSGLLLEVSTSLNLFGGRLALLTQLHADLRQQGLRLCTGEAPTAHGAWLLALAAQNSPKRQLRAIDSNLEARLDQLPVALLQVAATQGAMLDGIGCRTLADVRKLPRAGLARRFGPELLDELDRAYGRRPDPRISFEAPERFAVRVELMARVETSEALVFVAQRLMLQMTGWLAARRAAVLAFSLVLHHEHWGRRSTPPTLLSLALAQPSHDPAHLGGLVRERLGRMTLVEPVVELSLTADEIAEERVPNGELFPTPQSEAETCNRLIEKLSARLGSSAIQRLLRRADHRAERAYATVPASSKVLPKAIPLPVHAMPRPVWLMQAPQPLPLRGQRPVHDQTPLDLLAGPERIEAGWWDDLMVARDYYIAENRSGQLLWIYRERKVSQSDHDAWFLHGLFG